MFNQNPDIMSCMKGEKSLNDLNPNDIKQMPCKVFRGLKVSWIVIIFRIVKIDKLLSFWKKLYVINIL